MRNIRVLAFIKRDIAMDTFLEIKYINIYKKGRKKGVKENIRGVEIIGTSYNMRIVKSRQR